VTFDKAYAASFPTVTRFKAPIAGRQALVSNQKAKRVLGFCPQYTLENGPLAEALRKAQNKVAA